MKSLHQLKKTTSLLTIPLLLALGLMPSAKAVVPPPDGGYPGANTAEGQNALLSLTTGGFNTAVGYFSLSGVTTGNFNTAIGAGALFVNTADENTATGVGALLSNTQGDFNTANGAFALYFNTTGERNTAIGDSALFSNTSGSRNTGNGNAALVTNTTGNDNTATGTFALQRNNGDFNTAIGTSTLRANTSGMFNTAVGSEALSNNTIGNTSVAVGAAALNSNTTGSQNTAVGIQALLTNTTGMSNTAIGDAALSFNGTGSLNIALGYGAGSNLTGDNNIDIGNDGVSDESHTIRIGGSQTRTFIAGIRSRTTGNNNAIPVLIDSAGQLGTTNSSRRFKKEIKPMDKASEAVLALKPVSFHFKNDKTNRSEFGLIAEEVAEVNPDLVVTDHEGKPYTVRYDAVNAMLLNEFLKEHREVQELKKQVAALTAGLQKVSAQLAAASPSDGGLELNKLAPQTVKNAD